MAVRIPLVPAAPTDGKQYVQKDGAWITPPAATAVDDGLFSKEDKAALDGLVLGGGGATDEWISEVAGSTILLDKTGSAITSLGGDAIHLGSGDVDLDKMKGINLITNPAARVFNTHVWVGGDGNIPIRASKLPFIFDTEADAKIGAAWMIQELTTFLKSFENDSNFDSILNQFVGSEGKVRGGTSQPIFSADMDDNIWSYDSTVANQTISVAVTEWYELVVGRNRAGDKYWTCWVLPYRRWDTQTSAGVGGGINSISFRINWQHVANEEFSLKNKIRYFNNHPTPAALASDERDFNAGQSQDGLPSLTLRSTDTLVRSSNTVSPAPIWIEPITLELNR